MAVSGVTEQQYRNFLEHGGSLTFGIDAQDIDNSGTFETAPDVEPYLTSGFELPPTPIIHEAHHKEMVLVYGDTWTRIVAHTYLNQGRIVYKKLLTGRYEANVYTPPR